MRRRYDKAKANPPRCVNCDAKLAYDREGQPKPVCGSCERDRSDAPMVLSDNRAAYFTPNLEDLRQREGISYAELSRRSGVAKNLVRHAAKQEARVRPKTARKLAAALMVRPETITGTVMEEVA